MEASEALDPEALVVGGGLVTPALVAEASRHVEPDDFENPALRKLWGGLVDLVNAGQPLEQIDLLALAAKIAKTKTLQQRVAKYCGELLDGLPRFTSLIGPAETIRRRATMRFARDRIAKVTEELREQLEAPYGEVADLEERLTEISVEVAARGDGRLNRTVYKDKGRAIEQYIDELIVGAPPEVIPTGIRALDRRLGGGLRPGELYTVVAPTGAGKTAFASQVADHAVGTGRRAVLFSMEVDPINVYIRDLERTAKRSRWDLHSRSDKVRGDAQRELLATHSMMLSTDGKVVYGEPMSVVAMRQAILTEQLRGGPIALAVVDHAQVAKPSREEKQFMPRYLQVKGIASGLRQIAMRLHIAVLLTAQMNPPQNKSEKPSMALTRESKDIVNASDGVMVLWHKKEETTDGDVFITASFINLEKIRAGNPGRVKIRYHGETFRFEDEE